MHKPEDRSFIGHPRGLGYLAFTEAWERFSYYGMQSLLVLYMVNQLITPPSKILLGLEQLQPRRKPFFPCSDLIS